MEQNLLGRTPHRRIAPEQPGSPRGTGEPASRWIRTGLVYLSVMFLGIGLWATITPRSFYDGFPGGGRHWIAGDGPYNAHLLSDAGIGFLALGAVLALAFLWMQPRLTQAASIAVIVHTAPHLAFHLRHPHPALTGVDTAMSNGGLALSATLAVAVLAASGRTPRHDQRDEPLPNLAATTS